MQIGENEIEILNFLDDTTIFLLRDINCHTRIQSILKSHEKTSNSKTNFSEIQALWAVVHKNRINKPGQMVWSQVYINIFGMHFVNSVLDNKIWRHNK